MKVIAKSLKGNLLMLDRGEHVRPHRPSVVSYSEYIAQKETAGEIKVLAKDLPDTARDSDFEKTWESSEKNEDLAVSSYEAEAKKPEAQEATDEEKEASKKSAEAASATKAPVKK